MRILLTGRNGQVGWELERALPTLGNVVATDRTSLDLGNVEAIRRVIRETKPEVIVNAAAYTAVDKAESERDAATQANVVAPGIMGEEAKRLGALLVHYSTDYVFDGNQRTPYVETDAPNPLSHYARTKRDGERAVAASGCRHLIVRTSWVYGPRASNFYQIIRRRAEANEPMRMVDDQTSVPTTAAFVAECTISLIKQPAAGLLHVVPGGQATRYEFAREVIKASGSRSKVEPAKSAEFPAPARRPAYSAMSNRALAKLLGRELPGWESLLRRL